MEGDQELIKHVCKICSKSFQCGRSLGGHMRSHHLISIDHEEDLMLTKKNKLKPPLTVASSSLNTTTTTTTGYGLRENPKKTWRGSDFICSEQVNSAPFKGLRLCTECGKGFPSWKALFGHMKCHSERENNNDRSVSDCLDDDEYENENGGQSDCGAKVPSKRRRSKRRKRHLRLHVASKSLSSLSSANSGIEDQQEQEEVALCLIMLSRNADIKKVTQEEEEEEEKKNANTSAELQASGFGDQHVDTRIPDVCASRTSPDQNHPRHRLLEAGSTKRKLIDSCDPEFNCSGTVRRGRFDCTTCNKTFHSYQALGGHRAGHNKKPIPPLVTSEIESNDNTVVEMEVSPDHPTKASGPVNRELGGNDSKNVKSKQQQHECPVCLKVFPSGQALGGHKRSHMLYGRSSSASDKVKINEAIIAVESGNHIPKLREFLDLNLPAPPEEEESNSAHVAFTPPPPPPPCQWWLDSSGNYEPETRIGLVSH